MEYPSPFVVLKVSCSQSSSFFWYNKCCALLARSAKEDILFAWTEQPSRSLNESGAFVLEKSVICESSTYHRMSHSIGACVASAECRRLYNAITSNHVVGLAREPT